MHMIFKKTQDNMKSQIYFMCKSYLVHTCVDLQG